MKWAFISVSALVLAGAVMSAVADAAAIKPGLWEFTTKLQPARASDSTAPSSSTPQRQPDGVGATYTSCIESDRAVPAAFGPQCRLDGAEHSGARFSWSMTCTNSKGAVRSDGVAEYHGDAMTGTMVSQLPGPNGKVTHITQHIVGHHLGPCPRPAEMAAAAASPTPPQPAGHDTAGHDAASAAQPGMAAAAPPANAENAAPAGAPAETAGDAENAETVEPPGHGRIGHRHYAHHRHYSRHRYAGRRHHRHHRHYAYRYGGGAYSSYAASAGFGPAPRGGNGP
jgi:hypothetical protein